MWKKSVKVFILVLFTFVRSDNNSKSANLTGNFDAGAGCSRIFTNEQVIFESPSYPSGYPANADCSYLFKGPLCSAYFNFQFLDFNLVSSPGCVKDRLEINEQEAVCGSTSGTKSYFSQNGALQARFVSDDDTSGRGFRILVTRLPCGVKPETTTSDPNIAWEMTQNTIAPKTFPPALTPPGSNLPFCCANSYNSKRFFLSSPGFPYSNNNPTECVYNIYRANPNICRLRLHFLFFWSGEQDANSGCNKGFLQVDGKFICGCRIGLKLISAFDSQWGNAPKVIRFKNSGFPQSVFSGFALEVIQDECPKRLAPTSNSGVKALEEPQFYFYDDQINRVSFPNYNQNEIERALLVRENTEILDDGVNDETSGVVKHFYFFEAPENNEYDVRAGGKQHREIEETTYLDTSAIKSFLPDGDDNYKCRVWGAMQWAMLAQEYLWQQMPQCNGFANKPTSRQCEQANFIKGYVQSPSYPYYYPGNLKLCYRFERQPGYCAIRLNFVDFHLENSFQCQKDYLNFGGRYRYCAQSLYKTTLTFDLRSNPYQEMYFVTDDGYSCGRGFKGIYEQIPCANTGGPVNPPNPVYPTKPTTPFPPSVTPPPNPQTPCSRNIQDDVFIIEVYGSNQPRCVFNIFKRYPNVCRLSLTFLNFDLPCRNEHLLINNRRYCGQLNGQILNVNFNYHQLSIIYERSTANPPITGLRFRISGKQMSDGCDPYEFPNVPAERSIFSPNNTIQQVIINNKPEANSGTFSGRKYENDICGVVLNATEDTIASSICKFLKEHDNSTNCVQISTTIMYVPYMIAKDGFNTNLVNDLQLDDFDKIEEVEVNEVSCDDVDKIKNNNSNNLKTTT